MSERMSERLEIQVVSDFVRRTSEWLTTSGRVEDSGIGSGKVHIVGDNYSVHFPLGYGGAIQPFGAIHMGMGLVDYMKGFEENGTLGVVPVTKSSRQILEDEDMFIGLPGPKIEIAGFQREISALKEVLPQVLLYPYGRFAEYTLRRL